MHDERRSVEARLRREMRERILPAVYGARFPLAATCWDVPGEPIPVQAVPGLAAFGPISPGTAWGRPWGTTWFRLDGVVPDVLPVGAPVDVIVELGFSGGGPGFQAEGLVYVDGNARCGLHPRRRSVRLGDIGPGHPVNLLVEAAANPDFSTGFTPNPLGSLTTAGDRPLYVFAGAFLAVRDDEVEALYRDLEVLGRMVTALPDDNARRHRITRTIEEALNALDLFDVAGTAGAGRAILSPTLARRAAPGSHRVMAIGHAHIDTAWLWPIRETMRKCARTFANAVELMDEYPEYRFGCSQAVQYQWIEDQHPALFERIRAKVATGQWIPTGGMWVEADMNLPSGESIVRQLIHGQRYFESRFGRRCTEVWIPDVFGYPGSLPQIFAAGGCDNFVTQKLSWNKQNRMPHHTFWWEGIDGTRVLTHFPPVDTYNAEMQPDQLIHAEKNFSDKVWSDASIMPFGYGNGGGGPTREMLERARRMADLDGVPRVEQRAPSEFFEHVRATAPDAIPDWRGELYFEMHRGTLTSQTRTKMGNRRCERLLREAELWWATAALTGDTPPHRVAEVMVELDGLWKEVLVQQFHDILPGSSIAWVHDDAEAVHARIATRLEALIAEALEHVGDGAAMVANSATHGRDEVVVLEADLAGLAAPRGASANRAEAHDTADSSSVNDGSSTSGAPGAAGMQPFGVERAGRVELEHDRMDALGQRLHDGSVAVRMSVPGLGVASPVALEAVDEVIVSAGAMSNGSVAARWDDAGRLVSIVEHERGRELLRAGAAVELLLSPDHPVEYDAWDTERWTAGRAALLTPVGPPEVVEAGPLIGALRTTYTFGRSTVMISFTLRAGSPRLDLTFDIDWYEDEKLLAVDFPLDVHAATARCGIQFGHVERPTHTNTTWDLAKFEVCAHRWADLSEPSFGVAILDNGRYGHALQHGGIRITLQKAARFPDPTADRGRHTCTLAVFPHGPGLTSVVREAERLNLPLRVVAGTARHVGSLPAPVVTVGGANVEVSAVKLADDGCGDFIVRLHETMGDRTTVELGGPSGFASARRATLLEEPLEALRVVGGSVGLTLRPFEILTVRASLLR